MAAARILLVHLASMESVLSEDGQTEGNIRPLHIAYFRASSNSPRQLLTLSCKRFYAKHAQSDVIRSSNEGIELDHEAPPQGEDDMKGDGRTDFCIFVCDRSPLKRQGSIKLEENMILEESFSAFESQERIRFTSRPEALFPDKKYLVGDLYIANEWFSLPTSRDGGLASSRCLHLCESLLRIIIGDHVLGWAPIDVWKTRNIQRTLDEERFRLGGFHTSPVTSPKGATIAIQHVTHI
ncbi:hypothetical protein L7F22_000871 [Adiantum nelumboides]|nr:hypothetical protein [Adiantum nelumboides]